MPLTFTGYRLTDTDATASNANDVYDQPFSINGGASTSSITISDGSDSTTLYGDGSGDSPTDAAQTLISTTAPGVNPDGHIIYEAVVTFSGSDGNTYTAIIFDYDEDDSGNIDNNNSSGTNTNGLYEEGFFIGFIPNGFDPANVNPGDIVAGPVPPPGVTLTRTADVLNNAQFSFACFAKGSRITSANGEIPVEDLRVGDRVKTLDGRFEKVKLVVKRAFSAIEVVVNPKLRPVRISQGALGGGLPSRDLLVSRQHRMLVSSKIAARVCGADEVLVASNKLTELPGIFVDKADHGVTYFHIVLERHEVLFSEGAPTESFYMGTEALQGVQNHTRQEILEMFPQFLDAGFVTRPALPIPDNKRQKKIIARHVFNSKPVLAGRFLPHMSNSPL